MIVGNDVIDLTHQKYIFRQFSCHRLNKKIFNLQELALVNKEAVTTSLRRWTIKESVYKAYQRLYQLKPRFNPVSIHTDIIDEELSFGLIQGHKFKLQTHQNHKMIYTSIFDQLSSVSITYSSKKDLSKKLSDYFLIGPIAICKDRNNIPSIIIVNGYKPISLTHHGRFQIAQFNPL